MPLHQVLMITYVKTSSQVPVDNPGNNNRKSIRNV
jgi:hypothetical protein